MGKCITEVGYMLVSALSAFTGGCSDVCPEAGCLIGDVLGFSPCNVILCCKYMWGQQESPGNFLVRSQAHSPPLVNISLSVQKELLPAGYIKADLLHVAECVTCLCRLQEGSRACTSSLMSVPSAVLVTGLILKCFPLIIHEQFAVLITGRGRTPL